MMYAGIFIWQSGSPYSCTRQVFLGDTFVLGVRGKVLLAGLAMGCAVVGAFKFNMLFIHSPPLFLLASHFVYDTTN